MKKYSNYLKATKTLLKQSLEHKNSYEVTLLGKNFIVLPNVFSPKFFYDTEIFAKHLPIKKEGTLLEIGPGTGIISIIAQFKGIKKVVAVDINPNAVKNTRLNIKKHGLQKNIQARLGNLFTAIKTNEKFDIIFWNVPFGFIKKKVLTNLEKSVFDPNYKKIEQYIQSAHLHLKPKGKIYIGFSSTLGKLNLLETLAKKYKCNLKLIYQAKSKEIYEVNFEIFELKKFF